MNGFSAEPRGMPRSEQPARRQKLRDSAKAQVGRAETALHKYRARAGAILHAEGPHEETEEPHSTYVFKIIRHRETGVRVRILDMLADDAPAKEGKDVVHQYLVECQTHARRGPSFASARAAMVAARRPELWCMQCADLVRAQAQAKTRGRARDRSAGTSPRADDGRQ